MTLLLHYWLVSSGDLSFLFLFLFGTSLGLASWLETRRFKWKEKEARSNICSFELETSVLWLW